MSTTLPSPGPLRAEDSDAGTRHRVLRLVASAGPVTTAELAAELDLTPAAIRRHLGVLEQAEQIEVRDGGPAPSRRGRPARRYVVTGRGQAALSQRYSELASQALRFLSDAAGPDAVAAFAEQRVAVLEQRLAAAVDGLDDVGDRVHAMADALSSDGYEASARPVPGTSAVQLCQGHCPVQEVAHEFPQLCEAEARAFARLLGVHVQRLSTLAGGGHVCTTSIPVLVTGPTTRAPRADGASSHVPPHHPVLAPEGTTA